MKKINVVFPCGGSAERFGGTFKPFLKIGDLTFIEKAYEPFRKWSHMINNVYFIVTAEQEKQHNISQKIEKMFPGENCVISIIEKKTKGPVETFLQGYADKQSSFIVCDCDHSINVDTLFALIRQKQTADIIVPTWSINPQNQHNWSKILMKNHKIKGFANKEEVDFNQFNVRGIIGCIYFKSIELVKEREVSYVNFYEAIRRSFIKGKQIVLDYPQSAYFYGDPEMLADCIEQRRGECSIFCDIDGVILKHYDHSSNDPSDNVCLHGFDELKNVSLSNHTVVLTTARSEKFRKPLEALLAQKNVYYDKLVMGLPSGPRFLINDRKPKKVFTTQSNSIELVRNSGLSGLSKNIENVIKENKINILEDLSANSFAKTYLIQEDNRVIVRKHILKSSGEKHVHVLKRQRRDLERFNFLSDGFCPLVLGERESSIDYFYDMEYLNGYIKAIDLPLKERQDVVSKVLAKLNSDIYSLNKKINGDEWMTGFLNEKIYPKLTHFPLLNDEFSAIIDSEVIAVNNKKYYGLKKALQLIDFKDLLPSSLSVVHGDLTLENVMFNCDTKEIKLIDMDGARIFDSRELDLGKMCQSIISKYDQWKEADGNLLIKEIDLNTGYFMAIEEYFNSNFKTSMEETLISSWSNILGEPEDKIIKKCCFYMATYFIRFVPFRLQLSKKHGIFALLMAAVWLNKLIKE